MGHQGSSEQHVSLLDPDTASSVAAILQGLATPSRLRHLRNLRFVVTERQGRSVIYRLFDDHVVELIAQGLAHAEHLELQDNEGVDHLTRGDRNRGRGVPRP